MQDANIIKQNLENLINEMSTHPELWAKNPGKDFTRNRKLGFSNLIHVLLGMRGNSINKELYDYFKDDLMTSSAFVQQRSKLKLDTLKYLFDEFNKISEDDKTYNGYYLYAVDGSDINIATNPDSETYISQTNQFVTSGINQFHINALYDVLNKTYKDCIVQPRPKMHETKAAWQMVDRTEFKQKSILIADRGYGSFNLFEHINKKDNLDYLIRVKNNWLTNFKNLKDEEFDIDISFELRTSTTNQDKEDYKSGKAKFLSNMSIWDYPIPYTMNLRVVRIQITDSTYETIITSLNRFEFPLSKIKELYHLRWGIETSFRELKYAIGLVNFHAKKEEYILQEIYARMIIYNFCERITNCIVVKQDENRKWSYQVNYTMAIHICINFFKCNDPPDLISKYILPVREGRSDARKLKSKTVIYFLYRVA